MRPYALTGLQRDELLAEAVQQGTLLTLTQKAKSRWQTHKSRLLDMAPGRRALIVAYPTAAEGQTPEFLRGEQLGVALRHRNRKCLFAATVLDANRMTGDQQGEGSLGSLWLSWPERIEQLQRRVYYRAPVPADAPIDVRLWPGGLTPEDPTAPHLPPGISGRVLDLSVGGMRVGIAAGDDPGLQLNEVVGMAFSPEPHQPPLVLEACFRHAEPLHPSGLSLGLQFVGIELSPTGQIVLARLARTVSRLQRSQFHPRRLTT